MAAQQDDELAEIFRRATDYVRTIVGTLNSAKLLYFYARYKQANEGPCNTQRPGLFDFQGKQKWDAWNGLGNKSKMDAMVEYVSELSNTDIDWEDKAGVAKSRSGMGVTVSTMATEDNIIPDSDKNVFDWLKDDNVTQVTVMLEKCDINKKDSEGMALLHWACDRGLEEMVRLLLTSRADVNTRFSTRRLAVASKHHLIEAFLHMPAEVNASLEDADGQTPLHYAVSCEHTSVVRLLMEHGADTRLIDNDGGTAAEGSDNATLLQLLQGAT